jgi:hypothetical protein
MASVPRLAVHAEFAHRARMKRQAAGLAELGAAHGERGGLEIDVTQFEHQRFGQPQPCRSDEAE